MAWTMSMIMDISCGRERLPTTTGVADTVHTMDNARGMRNFARDFSLGAAGSAFVFLIMLGASSLSGDSEHGFAGSAGVALTALALLLTPVFTVLSVVAGMIQIGKRRSVIEQVGKWWALAVTSLALIALAIGFVS